MLLLVLCIYPNIGKTRGGKKDLSSPPTQKALQLGRGVSKLANYTPTII